MPVARRSVPCTLLLLAASATAAAAQQPTDRVPHPSTVLIPSAPFSPPPSDPTPGSLSSGLLSLAVPGAGQYRLGQSRTWAYLALEVAAWTVHLEEDARARDFRNRYHDLAWTVARIHNGARKEGTWDYYELLIHWTRSGAYDADPATPGTQPESDPTTYNGWIWTLARDIYLPPGQTVSTGDPAYQRALTYYQSRAYGPAFLWDWSGSPSAQQRYAHLVDRSDSGFRRATIALGAVFANHLISAADAYLSGSARRRPGDAHMSLRPTVGPEGTRWTALVRIRLPR